MELIHGDCLEEMKRLPDSSVDLILYDPPYGTIKNLNIKGWKNADTAWDDKLDVNIMFEQYNRILRPMGTIILFSQEPYTSEIRTYKSSSIKFCYPLIWLKNHFANPFSCKKAPVSYFEDISVFTKLYDSQYSDKLRIYARLVFEYIGKTKREIVNVIGQSVDHFFRYDTLQHGLCTEKTYNALIETYGIDNMPGFMPYCQLKDLQYQRTFNLPKDTKLISNVFTFNKENTRFHPTQKPIALLESLLNIYSNDGDVVLDNCMGSGSTGVACVNTNRKFIGIELNKGYFKIAERRINDVVAEKESKLF